MSKSKEEDFHAQRRMWAIINDELKVAPERDTRAHIIWFNDEGWVTGYDYNPIFETIIRGFVDDRGLFAYRGRDFEHLGVYHALLPHLPALKAQLSLSDSTQVFLGAVPARGGDRWDGKMYIGMIGEVEAFEAEGTTPRARRVVDRG